MLHFKPGILVEAFRGKILEEERMCASKKGKAGAVHKKNIQQGKKSLYNCKSAPNDV